MKNDVEIIYADEEHEPYGDLIQGVLDKLPEPVARRLCRECVFILMGSESYGQYHDRMDRYMILLNPALMDKDKLSPKEKQYVITHEIVHFYKKHNTNNPDDKDDEIEAEELAARWGFPAA